MLYPTGSWVAPCLGGLVGGGFPAQRPRFFTQHRRFSRMRFAPFLSNGWPVYAGGWERSLDHIALDRPTDHNPVLR